MSGTDPLDSEAMRIWDLARRSALLPNDAYVEGKSRLSQGFRRASDAAALLDACGVPEETIERLRASASGARAAVKRLGRYRIVRSIGAGGMGAVYLAVDDEAGVTVALKVLQADALMMMATDGLERFKREASALSRLPHPNIVHVVEAGEADGTPFLALEYVEGGPLSGADYATMPMDRKLAIVRDMARALAHAHANSVVHRDMKPSNILLRKDGTAVLTDFGLARDAEVHLRLTQSVALLGTPAYMSPEQAEGITSAVDYRTDIYSLGVVLYELTSGALPYPDSDIDLLIRRIRQEDPVPLREAAPDAPAGVEAVVAKAMERRPEDRYATAQAMAEDVERLMAGHAPAARRPSLAGRSWRAARRRPWHVAGIGGALVLVGLTALAGTSARLGGVEDRRAKSVAAVEEALDAQAAGLRRVAEMFETSRITAGLEELRSKGTTAAARAEIEEAIGTQVEMTRAPAGAVMILDEAGRPVAWQGPSEVQGSVSSAFRADAARVVAVAPGGAWVFGALPLDDESPTAGGYALVGSPVEPGAAHAALEAARAHVAWSRGSDVVAFEAGARGEIARRIGRAPSERAADGPRMFRLFRSAEGDWTRVVAVEEAAGAAQGRLFGVPLVAIGAAILGVGCAAAIPRGRPAAAT